MKIIGIYNAHGKFEGKGLFAKIVIHSTRMRIGNNLEIIKSYDRDLIIYVNNLQFYVNTVLLKSANTN